MSGKTTWGVVALSVLALSVTPGKRLAAQAPVVSPDDVRIERAELLTHHAWQLARLEGDFARAASLLRDAAELRGNDAQAVKALRDAGYFNYYAGRTLNAVSALKAAGETAELLGDLASASDAFRDGAWVAEKAGEVATAREMLQRSRTLGAMAAALSAAGDGS